MGLSECVLSLTSVIFLALILLCLSEPYGDYDSSNYFDNEDSPSSFKYDVIFKSSFNPSSLLSSLAIFRFSESLLIIMVVGRSCCLFSATSGFFCFCKLIFGYWFTTCLQRKFDFGDCLCFMRFNNCVSNWFSRFFGVSKSKFKGLCLFAIYFYFYASLS